MDSSILVRAKTRGDAFILLDKDIDDDNATVAFDIRLAKIVLKE